MKKDFSIVSIVDRRSLVERILWPLRGKVITNEFLAALENPEVHTFVLNIPNIFIHFDKGDANDNKGGD